jgi:EAL domain-containing protein (putative c-di-GMP-specific phosphodiesterase class I)
VPGLGIWEWRPGVETQRQARRLREIGCDFAQGYHFGRPVDPASLLRT